jgi:SAM-dependent methyltransferase
VEQFFGPLLLASATGASPNAWYRGNLEGIDLDEIARLLPFARRFAPNVFLHVTLPALLHRRARMRSSSLKATSLPTLPKRTLSTMLDRLHRSVTRLVPHPARGSDWETYRQLDAYCDDDIRAKGQFVARFIQATKPRLLLDLGCHNGTYAELALTSGARAVIAVDADSRAADTAFNRARASSLNMNVLQMDLTNPSPSQGWNGKERQSFRDRISADAVLALALVHHISIARNVPLTAVVDWIISLAPCGIIEFVDPTDRQVERMLRFRGPAPRTYTRENFLDAMASRSRIVDTENVVNGSRLLVWYSWLGE